jgi:hypothetical protein
MIVARQFIVWNRSNRKIRPVLSAIARMATEEGHGMILTHGWLVVLTVARLSDPITTSLRDGSF